MPTQVPNPCPVCRRLGCIEPSHSRQARARAHHRRKRIKRPYSSTEQRRRAEAVEQYVKLNGYVCPGWQVPPHKARDLTADHTVSVGAGGPESGPLGILCRSCNSRKKAQLIPRESKGGGGQKDFGSN